MKIVTIAIVIATCSGAALYASHYNHKPVTMLTPNDVGRTVADHNPVDLEGPLGSVEIGPVVITTPKPSLHVPRAVKGK
jgi:hypothetical protein